MAISVLVGILTGVLSAIVVSVSSNIYRYLVLPWFQTKVYQGVLLAGRWSGFAEIGNIRWDMVLDISQRGSKVFGSLLAKSDSTEAKKNETDMTFSGNIYDGYMIINCLSKDPREISFGSMILRIRNKKMTGYQIFRDLSESKYDVFKSKVEFIYT